MVVVTAVAVADGCDGDSDTNDCSGDSGFCVTDLVDKEPCREEESDAHEDESEVGEDGGVDGRDVAREGVKGGHGHLDSLQGLKDDVSGLRA